MEAENKCLSKIKKVFIITKCVHKIMENYSIGDTMKEEFNPLVSIVIPVYNGAEYMREAIDSALAQTYKNIEVIVVNDGSKDNTDEIARSYGEKIRYFKKENGGVSTALNLAIQNMQGEYFSWLSHDDVYLPEKIERQIDVLRKLTDKTTVVNTAYSWINSKSKIFSIHIPFIPRKFQNVGLFYFFMYEITGCGLLIHKMHFNKAGLFDPKLKIVQDYDLWFKILRYANFAHINEPLVKIREHAKRVTNLSPIYFSELNEIWSKLVNMLTEAEIIKTFHDELSFYFLLRRFIYPELPTTSKIVYRSYRAVYEKRKLKIRYLMQKWEMSFMYYILPHSKNTYNILAFPFRCLRKYKTILIKLSDQMSKRKQG